MVEVRFSAEDHARVTAAVAEAERGTDGEIVTIVTARSDAYHDVGLHYAVGATLLVAALAAAFPQPLAGVRDWWFHHGWPGESELAPAILIVLVAQTIAFLLVRYALAYMPLRMLLTPKATRVRRVRRRALQFFRSSAEKRTVGRVGVLLYLSLAEHRAEIIADEAIHAKVPEERWGEAMAALVAKVRQGDAAGGMVDAVGRIAAIVGEHFPKTAGDANELPDRLIEL